MLNYLYSLKKGWKSSLGKIGVYTVNFTLSAEERDYQNGRSSLNDLIQSLNTIQSNRLFKTNAKIELAKKRIMILEQLDMLVTKIDN